MSSKRKLRRAQQARSGSIRPEHPSVAKQASARTLLEMERFRVSGSDVLWPALLGWDETRTQRAWLYQAVHDAARSEAPEPAACLQQFARRVPEAGEQLTPEQLAPAIDLWRVQADRSDADEAEPVWELLTNLCDRAGLGRPEADDARRDWNLWTNLTLAGTSRKALMEALASTERAALALDEFTDSEDIASVAGLARIVWSAIAYGDRDTFAAIRRFTAEWEDAKNAKS